MSDVERKLQQENQRLKNTIADFIKGNVILKEKIEQLEIELDGARCSLRNIANAKKVKKLSRKKVHVISSAETVYL